MARVLALHVAHYRQRYGDVSIEESLEMLRAEKISDEQAKILANGFGVLVEVLKALGLPRGNVEYNYSLTPRKLTCQALCFGDLIGCHFLLKIVKVDSSTCIAFRGSKIQPHIRHHIVFRDAMTVAVHATQV